MIENNPGAFVTTAEFFEELKKVRIHFDWKFRVDTRWAAERRVTPRLHIRAKPKEGPAKDLVILDPIGAVCYARNAHIHDEQSWRKAAQTLGLSPTEAAELRAASNDNTWAGTEGHREPVEHLQALRDRLIATVGLSVTD